MPYSSKSEDAYNVSETGNWNVAADYSKLKIMKPLYVSDEYAAIAMFGTATLFEELQNTLPVDRLKLKGFERLVSCLVLICDNALFAVKKDKEELEEIKVNLLRVKKIIPHLSIIQKSERKGTKEIKIVSEKYEQILEYVLQLKAKLNYPLNKNHLIFTDKEEFDPIEYKKQVMEEATRRG